MYKHFIITRFNLRLDEWKITKSGETVLTDEWLSHRFKLFERWCFPSVKNQVEQNFTWLVCFDTLTPDTYKKVIADIGNGWDNFIPLFIDGHRNFYSSILRYITTHTTDEYSHIITSRLDNDDALHEDYIKTVQDSFCGQQRGIIDISDGYQFALGTSPAEIRTVSDLLNPFISLVEKNNEPQTVLSRMHRDWNDCSDRTIIKGKPLWLQIVHEKNLLNCIVPTNHYTNNIELDKFGYKGDKIELMTSLNVAWMNTKRVHMLYIRKLLQPLLRIGARIKRNFRK